MACRDRTGAEMAMVVAVDSAVVVTAVEEAAGEGPAEARVGKEDSNERSTAPSLAIEYAHCHEGWGLVSGSRDDRTDPEGP